MKGSEIDDPGHLIGLKPRRFPNWGALQQPIKICPLCSFTLVVDIYRLFSRHRHVTATSNKLTFSMQLISNLPSYYNLSMKQAPFLAYHLYFSKLY